MNKVKGKTIKVSLIFLLEKNFKVQAQHMVNEDKVYWKFQLVFILGPDG